MRISRKASDRMLGPSDKASLSFIIYPQHPHYPQNLYPSGEKTMGKFRKTNRKASKVQQLVALSDGVW